jgi:hypothetical protein
MYLAHLQPASLLQKLVREQQYSSLGQVSEVETTRLPFHLLFSTRTRCTRI